FVGVEKNLVGYISAIPDEQLKNTVHLVSLAVKPSHRRKGIGRRLLKALEKDLRYKGVNTLIISLSRNQPKNIMYFQECDFLRECIDDPEFVHMSKCYEYSESGKRRIRLRKLISYIEKLYAGEHLQILESLLNVRKDDKKFARKACDLLFAFQRGGKKKSAERKVADWMEARILNSQDPKKMTPVRLAFEYRHYFHIPRNMDPKLRQIARKVKNKLYIRSIRKRSAEGIINAPTYS
ncbi:MAG TPA: GNAT family N-acetyltransferase, partial [Syntrophales bacterium]|nr:GNAT family N-acetyltransferase [Syntrophales bacterium]